MEILLIVLLVLLNGLFAMAEIAVVSARRAKLQNLADSGNPGARRALELNQNPTGFLSTVQVGITGVAILSGAIGEGAISEPLSAWLSSVPPLAPYARVMSLALTVVVLTYFSVVVGELVPKQLALLAPESIASAMAGPLAGLSRLAHPAVALFAWSSTLVLRLFGARRKDEPPVTDEEIKVLMEQGAEAGIFHESEQEIVSNVLRLDEQSVVAIMTPRPDMVLVDLAEGDETARRVLTDSAYSRLVVCRDGLDQIVGIVQAGDLLKKVLPGRAISTADIEAAAKPPLYVPESITTTRLLDIFRSARQKFALIVDEYGEVQGMATLTDVMSAIVGELAVPEAPEERDLRRRDDGSWLADGDVGVERLKAQLDIEGDLPGEAERNFHTLGGFIMNALGRVPAPTDHLSAAGYRFEVMDMDRNRVDKVLIVREPVAATPDAVSGRTANAGNVRRSP